MTKLKKPIVVKIETVECASMLSAILEMQLDEFSERIQRLGMSCRVPFGTGIKAQIANQLTAQGIDYRTWEPPQPLLVGPHEVSASPDGSVTVGCTTVTRPTLEAIFKLSSEAMGVKSEPEWPKWFTDSLDGTRLYFVTSESDTGTWHYVGGRIDKYTCEPAMQWMSGYTERFKQITPQAAREILEAKG